MAAPAIEPVTLEEAKAHMRVDYSDDDALITGLLKAARECIEATTNRRLITQQWVMFEDKFPHNHEFTLSHAPVQSVDLVRLWDINDAYHTLAPTEYIADVLSEPARVFIKQHPAITLRPHTAIEIVFTCGYGSAGSDVPESLRLAIKMLAAHWYENRMVVADAVQTKFAELPMGLQYILNPYRLWWRQI